MYSHHILQIQEHGRRDIYSAWMEVESEALQSITPKSISQLQRKEQNQTYIFINILVSRYIEYLGRVQKGRIVA